MTAQILSSCRSPSAEPLLVAHAGESFQQQWLQENEKTVDLNPCVMRTWSSEAQETKGQNSPTMSRMSTAATESAFDLDHWDLMNSDGCKAPLHEPQEVGGSDDKSSKDESTMPQACRTEAIEDASELAECFDGLAAPGLPAPSVAASATSYSRNVLLSVNANLSRQVQQMSAPPSGSVTLPKALPVRVKCPSLSLESSATKAPVEVDRAIDSPAQAISRGVLQGVTGKQTEPIMTEDSPKQSTIMLRNIPNRSSCVIIAQQLEAHGFGGAYDLVYVPTDKTTGNLNLGYAFVNFRKDVDCSRFRDAFNGKCAKALFPNSSSDKVLIVALASVQGRDAYWKRLSSFVWPAGTEPWQPLIFGDDGRRIRLPVGRPRNNSEGTAAAACTASHNSSILRAEAPEFVPTTGLATSGETNFNVDCVLDHLLIPSCNAQFCGAPGLMRDASMCHQQSLVYDCCSIQPEIHMAALAKAIKHAQSRSGQATEVLAARCEQQLQEEIPMAEDQPTNAVTLGKRCTADVSSRSSPFVTLASAFVAGFLLASSFGLTSQSVVASGLEVCQAVSRS